MKYILVSLIANALIVTNISGSFCLEQQGTGL